MFVATIWSIGEPVGQINEREVGLDDVELSVGLGSNEIVELSDEGSPVDFTFSGCDDFFEFGV